MRKEAETHVGRGKLLLHAWRKRGDDSAGKEEEETDSPAMEE